MSKNNKIKKSDKKFIRLEKARIRAQFSDSKKQEELISELYKRILGQPESADNKEVKKDKIESPKLESKKGAKRVNKVEKKKIVKSKKHEPR